MEITARWAGTCYTCRKPITVGSIIRWSKEVRKARHFDCNNPDIRGEVRKTLPPGAALMGATSRETGTNPRAQGTNSKRARGWMYAKFNGTCLACHKDIGVGEKIVWSNYGDKARHVECIMSLSDQVDIFRARWKDNRLCALCDTQTVYSIFGVGYCSKHEKPIMAGFRVLRDVNSL